MGDVGVASTPDANSLAWNPAKYAFIDNDLGVSISYSPWLRQLVNDINLAYLSGYKKLDENQTVAASLRSSILVKLILLTQMEINTI